MFTASKNVSLLTYTNAIRKFHILKRPWQANLQPDMGVGNNTGMGCCSKEQSKK